MKYHIFDLDDLHQLNVIVHSTAERIRVIDEHKATYPDAKVYWQAVNEG